MTAKRVCGRPGRRAGGGQEAERGEPHCSARVAAVGSAVGAGGFADGGGDVLGVAHVGRA